MNRNAYENDYRNLGPLQQWAVENGIAILAITHTRKTKAAEDPVQEIMGSSGIPGVADTILMLKRARGENEGKLSVLGREVEEAEYAVRFNTTNCQYQVLGEASEVSMSVQRKAVLDVLKNAEFPMGPRQIAEILEKGEDSVKKLLSGLVESGQAMKMGRGKYFKSTMADHLRVNENLELIHESR